MRKIHKNICLVMAMLFFSIPILGSLETKANSLRASDTVSKQYSKTINYTKTAVSASPDVGSIPSKYRNVSFSVTITGEIQYDRLTGSFVSASTPTARINYEGPVNLGIYGVSTSKYDNGNEIVFSFSADVKGTVYETIPITINYGRINGEFRVPKR